MGMGLPGAYGADALQQYLRQRVADQMAQEKQAADLGAQQQDLGLRSRGLDQQAAETSARLAQTAAEKAAAEGDKQFTQGIAASNAIPAGTAIPTTSPLVRRLQMVGALQHQDATLPSTPAHGMSTGTPGGTQQIRGTLRAMPQPGNPEQYVKLASEKQQQDAQTNTEKGQAAARLDQQAAETARHDHAMENKQPATGAGAENSRLDRSYQFNSGQLEKVAAPISAKIDQIGRLSDELAQRTPQADALAVPLILTATAGGAGTGIRMNQAELERISGGRSNWESLQAAFNKWQTDPTKALSITDSQRQQMTAIVHGIQAKAAAKLDAITKARDALVDAPDVTTHRRIVADVQKQLAAIDGGAAQAGPAGGGTVNMKAPNGQVKPVPADQVEHFKSLGAVVVP